MHPLIKKIASFPLISGFVAIAAALPTGRPARAADFVVYSEYQALNMGNPGEKPQKDYYVNMGSSNGVQEGTELEVLRRISTYDLLSERLYKDLRFPVARLKVIHVESKASVARLEKILPPESTPAVANHEVMIGDIVRISQ